MSEVSGAAIVEVGAFRLARRPALHRWQVGPCLRAGRLVVGGLPARRALLEKAGRYGLDDPDLPVLAIAPPTADELAKLRDALSQCYCDCSLVHPAQRAAAGRLGLIAFLLAGLTFWALRRRLSRRAREA